MRDQRLEQLGDANVVLRTAVESALLFAEEVAQGNHGQAEAEAMVSVLREALAAASEDQG